MTDNAPGAALAAAQADDAFGVDLYRVLGARGGNVVFSPASIAAALRMALLGARKVTPPPSRASPADSCRRPSPALSGPARCKAVAS